MRECDERTFGNASSIHSFGRDARVVLEQARAEIGKTLHATPAELIFTSGGTESVNLGIEGLLARNNTGRKTIVTSLVEHPAVLEVCTALEKRGYKIRYVGSVGSDGSSNYGQCTVDALQNAITDDTALVVLMHANNEIGTVNNIAALSQVAHDRGALFFCDAVQSYGKIPVDVRDLDVDALAICAHKIYGPKGIGALYVKGGISIEPLIRGGSQERNRRGGTESVSLAVGFQVAAREAQKEMRNILVRTAKLKQFFVNALTEAIPGLIFTMHPDDALPHIVSVTFEQAEALEPEAIVPGLDLHNIAASNGAACSSGSGQPSHVLLALGMTKAQAACAVRFSIGRDTTEKELSAAVAALKDIVSVK